MRSALFVLAVTTALAMPGCKDRTELVLGIATDIKSPDALSRVELRVRRVGAPQDDFSTQIPWDITNRPAEDFNLPGSFGLISEDDRKVDVELIGFRGEEEIVKRSARLGILEGETLFYRIGLTAGCETRAECPQGLTCVEGTCRPLEIDFRFMPSFNEQIAEQVTCLGTTTYVDTSTGNPMAVSPDAGSCPATLCAEGTCLVPPAGVAYCECSSGETCIGGVCVAPPPAASCALRTGQQCCAVQDDTCTPPDDTCRCDQACLAIGDCCPDYCSLCGGC